MYKNMNLLHFQASIIVVFAIIASVTYSSPVAQPQYDAAAPVPVAAPLVVVSSQKNIRYCIWMQ